MAKLAAGEWRSRIKGRGVAGNPKSHYLERATAPCDDGWDGLDRRAREDPTPSTELFEDRACSALAWNQSPDLDFDRSLNPYQGCEHGCVYCYARPSHGRHGFSPGLDFETKIFAKRDAATLLEREFAARSYKPATIALGANTDAYQPMEMRLRITRQVLEVLARARHPVAITTKSDRVLRDLDLLAPMAAQGLVAVNVSITTLDGDLARSLEPRAASPSKRLAAIEGLAARGVPANVFAAPMIPGLNDHELESILEAAARAGARGADWTLLRLPHEVEGLMRRWLETHRPGQAGKVWSLLRQCHGGALKSARFFERMRGDGPYAQLLARRFAVACERLDLERRIARRLRVDLFRRPQPEGQLSLL